MGLLLGACLWTVVLFGFFLPIAAFWETRHRAKVAKSISTQLDRGPQTPFDDLIEPLFEIRRVLTEPSRTLQVGPSLLAGLGAWISFWSALALFAVIPVGGVFEFRGEAWSALLADPPWGLMVAFIAPAAALFGSLLRQVAVAGDSAHGRLSAWDRRAPLACLALGASLIPLLLTYGTLRPLAIGLIQDASFASADFEALLGLDSIRSVFTAARLPRWGLLLNPLSAALFFCASLLFVGSRSFQGPVRSDQGDGGGGGLGAALVLVSARLWILALSALFVFLYLGGGAIPALSQGRIVDWIAPYFGLGFAQIICLAAQAATFVLKWVIVLKFWVMLASRSDVWPESRVQKLCRRVLIPGALLDLAMTIFVLIRLGNET